MKQKLFSTFLIVFVISLALLCVYYGTSFAPTLSSHRRLPSSSPSSIAGQISYADDDVDPVFGSFLSSPLLEVSSDAVAVKSFPVCDVRLSELIPCLDRNLIYQLKLKLNLSLMEHYERHCPPPDRRYNCLIPPPRGYKLPIQWPASRDEVWKANIPHTHLASEKSDQNWMVVNGEKINFPGGGTHFHTGADKYIIAIAKMLKFPEDNLSNGGSIRNVLDVGCGVASFGAYLLPLDIIAMSLAPNDVHENQIQFALERGIPATLGVLGTRRLPYPSRSFELAHCSRCRIDWLQRDGILLLELDRLLRPGGYFVYSSPEAYAQDEENRKIWTEMSDLLGRMCWRVASKKDQTVVWVKPTTNGCYWRRKPGTKPLLCPSSDNPDVVWNVTMKACLTPYSKRIHKAKGDELVPWPKRLTAPPPRLEELGIKSEKYVEDTELWQSRVIQYWKQMKKEIEKHSLRNVMDMRASLGGFGASLIDKDVWVMNVVPVDESSKLKIIYDRGLIGTIHDCVEDLLIEMDRILRPHGFAIIRDNPMTINYIKTFLPAMRWDGWRAEAEPPADALSTGEERVLIVRKKFWKASTPR